MGRADFSRKTIDSAFAVSSDEDAALTAILRLERTLLDRTPSCPSEAVAMLDVIIPDLAAGGRSDGRDVSALASIRTMLSTL